MPVIPIRPVRIVGDTAEIPLSKGMVALVDADCVDKVSQFNWYASKIKTKVYAARDIRVDGIKTVVLLHRHLMDAHNGTIIDHINGDGLDNRMSNLRFATAQQNCFNSAQRSDNSSGFRGVWRDKRRGKWIAEIIKDKRKIYIGSFEDINEAAKAYRKSAIELFGEFASLDLIKAYLRD